MARTAQVLPTGTVTFLLTDIEGSTRQWEDHPDKMGEAVARHEEVIQTSVEERGGILIRTKGEGDSTFSVFPEPTSGLQAVVEMQRSLAAQRWPEGIDIRVRAALYTGEAELREGTYYGTAPNRAARLRAVAHGGQAVLSQTTADLVSDELPVGIRLRDLGLHRLKDLSGQQRIFQICYPGGPQEFPPLQSLDAFVHSLPAQRTSFVGREKELAEVARHITSSRLVTLIGVGGSGKTRLALQSAAEHIEDFPDGVFFVDLSPLPDEAGLPTTVAAGVGLARGGFAVGTGRSPREELVDHLSPRRCLVVLDNCEHIVEVCSELVDELLVSCPRLSVLATSREALGVEGEQIFPVPPLATSEDAAEGNGTSSDAVQLFCDRASAVRSSYRLTEENLGAVREICRKLDGIPLAIELAASQIAHLSPAQVAERMTDRFRLVAGGRRTHRQQTLRAALDWSHDLLSPTEQRVLRRLAVFSGGFTLMGAEEVCADDDAERHDIVDVLGSLVNKSMVIVEERAELRYRLLETVRLYAEEKLFQAGEAEMIRSRHRDCLLSWVEGFTHEELGNDRHLPIWLAERDNLRTAIEWSTSEGRQDLVGRMMRNCLLLLIAASDEESERWVSLGLEAELDPEVRLDLLSLGALLSVMRFQPDSVVERSAEAIRLSATVQSHFAPLAVYSSAARWMSAGAFDKARAVLDEAAELMTPEHGLPRGILLGVQADLLVSTGRYHESLDLWDVTLAEFDRVNLPWPVVYSGSTKAIVQHLVGNMDLALRSAESVFEVYASAPQGFPVSEVWARVALALGRGGVGDEDGARAAVADLVEAQRRRAVPGALASGLIVLAALEAQRGSYEDASRLLAASKGRGRSNSLIALYRHYRDEARAALDPEVARRCRDEGREMSVDEALSSALS